MPTVVDALVLELGLDASKFNEQQRKAVDSLRGLQEGAAKSLKPVQKGFDDLGESFRLIQGRLLAIGALIATGLGFNRLVQDVTKANTELGNLSRTLGMTAQDLSAWENAGRTVGASTGEIAQNMKAINAQIQEFHATGKSSLQTLMGQVGIKPLQPNDTPDTVALRLSEWYAQQPNKAFASHLLQTRGGLSQGMINMIGLGPQELEKRLNFAKQFGPSNEDINQFKKLTDAFGNLMTVLTALERDAVLPLTNVLTKVLTMITDWLAKVHLLSENPADAAGDGAAKLGYPELAPNKSKPSLFSRGWNWLRGRSSSSGDGAGSASSPNESVQNRFGNWQSLPGGASAPSGGGSAFLQRQRQNFTDQAANPAVRERILAMALTEGDRDPTRVIESLANRFGYVNDERAKRGLPPVTLDQMLTPKFYGPMRGPKFDRALEDIRGNSAIRGRMERGLQEVSGGSNLLQGFTDQGLPTDPNGWRTPRIAHGGNVFNDWNGGAMFGVGDYRNAAAWREKMMAGVAADRTGSTAMAGFNVGPIGSGADRSFRLWQNLGLGSKGALIRGGDSSTTNNSNTATTHIGSMNVTVPPGANPSQYAQGISQKLEQYNNVAHSIQGLQ